jgi:hypothetical protein
LHLALITASKIHAPMPGRRFRIGKSTLVPYVEAELLLLTSKLPRRLGERETMIDSDSQSVAWYGTSLLGIFQFALDHPFPHHGVLGAQPGSGHISVVRRRFLNDAPHQQTQLIDSG